MPPSASIAGTSAPALAVAFTPVPANPPLPQTAAPAPTLSPSNLPSTPYELAWVVDPTTPTDTVLSWASPATHAAVEVGGNVSASVAHRTWVFLAAAPTSWR